MRQFYQAFPGGSAYSSRSVVPDEGACIEARFSRRPRHPASLTRATGEPVVASGRRADRERGDCAAIVFHAKSLHPRILPRRQRRRCRELVSADVPSQPQGLPICSIVDGDCRRVRYGRPGRGDRRGRRRRSQEGQWGVRPRRGKRRPSASPRASPGRGRKTRRPRRPVRRPSQGRLAQFSQTAPEHRRVDSSSFDALTSPRTGRQGGATTSYPSNGPSELPPTSARKRHSGLPRWSSSPACRLLNW